MRLYLKIAKFHLNSVVTFILLVFIPGIILPLRGFSVSFAFAYLNIHMCNILVRCLQKFMCIKMFIKLTTIFIRDVVISTNILDVLILESLGRSTCIMLHAWQLIVRHFINVAIILSTVYRWCGYIFDSLHDICYKCLTLFLHCCNFDMLSLLFLYLYNYFIML